MLPSSDFTILFSRSKDYLRCAFLIHVLAIIVLIHSSISPLISIPLIVFLVLSMIKISRSGIPLPDYHKITYHPGYWLLHNASGKRMKFERASISFDGGLFLLLRLTGIYRQKTIVIFNDQISTDQYRVLKLVSCKAKKEALSK